METYDYLIYSSKTTNKFEYESLGKILQTAQRQNPVVGVTGALIFSNDHFLQYIEGGTESVNQLYLKIARDHRHDHVMLKCYSNRPDRLFGHWAMKHIEESLIEQMNCPRDEFGDLLISEISVNDATQLFEQISKQ